MTTPRMGERSPLPVPEDIAAILLDELPTSLTRDELFAVERLVEFAYASGYAAAHLRGYQTGRRDERRAQAAAGQRPAPTPPADEQARTFAKADR
jgi:hypothetical protein